MNISLEQQREEFTKRRFLAMPIARIIAWFITGLSGMFLSEMLTVWVLFISTGSIVYMGIFISKFTGENFLDREKPKNEFDSLFMHTVVMAVLVYSIAIPFFMVDYESLPLTVGILTGLMWVTFSWVVKHWIGIFHTLSRMVLVVSLWYLLPEARFTAIPAAIILVYFATIFILENRWRRLKTAQHYDRPNTYTKDK